MIKHMVMWRLNGADAATRQTQAADIKAGLEALNGRIPGMIRLEIGIDFSDDVDASGVVLYSEFENREALAGYHHHPEHLALAPLVKAARSERRVVDYEV